MIEESPVHLIIIHKSQNYLRMEQLTGDQIIIQFVYEIKYNQNIIINPLSTNPAKWSNTLKQFAGNSNHFVGLAFRGLSADGKITLTVFISN